MPFQDRQLDFEDFSSDTEKLSAILKRTEISSQKHKLCYEYYRARKLSILYPSILACAFIGIVGFTVSTDAIKRHMKINNTIQVEDVLTIIVGFLGFIVGLNMLLMNQYEWGSRENFHLSAVIELDNLGDRVRYWKMDKRVGTQGGGVDDGATVVMNGITGGGGGINNGSSGEKGERKALGVVEEPDTHKIALVVASGKALKKVESEIQSKTVQAKKAADKRSDVSRFSGFNGAYQQINRSCKSTIPTKLSRPFDLFETRLECMSLGHLGIIWDTRMRRNQIMRLAAVEIYNEITGYWAWPFGTPDIEHVIDKSMKRVARLISKDYRAPVKVDCCGFTIFRCCCRKRDSKFNVLDNIWDGMEDRERDVMNVRGVADYVDTGEKYYADTNSRGGRSSRRGMNQLEDDAYEADQKLKQYENGSYYDEDSYYTQEDSRYSRGEYSRARQNGGGSRGRGLAGDYSISDRGENNGWDEASASQYGNY